MRPTETKHTHRETAGARERERNRLGPGSWDQIVGPTEKKTQRGGRHAREKEVERDWALDLSREGKRDSTLGPNRGSHREENTNTERDGRRVREGEK